MRRLGSSLCLFLVTTVLSSTASVAQEQLPSDANTNSNPSAAISLAEYRASPIFDTSGPLKYTHNPFLYLAQTPKASAKSNKPSIERIKRATMDHSMVGYIDNAIIHPEVRIRFDSARDDETPDRAEFFYAKCGCYAALPSTNTAYDPRTPGPGPGIPKTVNFQQLYFYGEVAPHPHLSFFTQLPFRWLQPQSFPGTSQAFPSTRGLRRRAGRNEVCSHRFDSPLRYATVPSVPAIGRRRTRLRHTSLQH